MLMLKTMPILSVCWERIGPSKLGTTLTHPSSTGTSWLRVVAFSRSASASPIMRLSSSYLSSSSLLAEPNPVRSDTLPIIG